MPSRLQKKCSVLSRSVTRIIVCRYLIGNSHSTGGRPRPRRPSASARELPYSNAHAISPVLSQPPLRQGNEHLAPVDGLRSRREAAVRLMENERWADPQGRPAALHTGHQDPDRGG